MPRASQSVPDTVSVSRVRPVPPPPPLPPEEAEVLAVDELLAEQAGAGDGAPTVAGQSTAPPPVEPRLERRPRRWVGWVAVTIAVGASASILAAAAVARTRAHAAATLEASEVPAARPALGPA